LREELQQLEERIEEASREIEDLAAGDDTARRLMRIPGIGPLGATAFLAAAEMPVDSAAVGTWRRGSGSCRGSIRQAERIRY
jgi:transposase